MAAREVFDCFTVGEQIRSIDVLIKIPYDLWTSGIQRFFRAESVLPSLPTCGGCVNSAAYTGVNNNYRSYMSDL
jgi:hypothetical protein